MVDTQAWIANVTSQIGGYDAIISELVNQIWILQSNAVNDASNAKLPRSKGAVIHGRPGTGKTALALAVAKHSNIPYFVLNAPDLFQAEEGASEAKLLKLFKSAQQHPFSIVILDELDLLAVRLAGKKSDLDIRVAATLKDILDNVNTHDSQHSVYVIGLTSRLHAIDPCFLRSGRLDTIFELTIKTPLARQQVLDILARRLPFASSQDRSVIIETVSKSTHGFVPSDLQNLCTQILLQLVKQGQTPLPTVSLHHFEEALKIVQPSSMNEYAVKSLNIRFEDIFGIDSIIQEIKTSVINPFQNPRDYITLGISPPRGILVHGPPGVGKTMLCSALAAESGVNFMFVESSQIRSKIVGESEKNLAKLFSQARANAPCILFIDQIDMLLPKRGTSSSSENTSDRIITSFLTEMDGLLTQRSMETAHIDVLVVGATNRMHVMDPAVLRPGRFDEHIYIPLPDQEQRLAIIDGLCSKMPTTLTHEDRVRLSAESEGLTGADLANIFREAAMASLRENLQSDKITLEHIMSVKNLVSQ
ncbi:hypothetical protein VTP01DRAFT_7402 [Rhizomucor pusillus]|uniref:uncharacterized protein n=1 Tax=Rhizomucor pusillus TaxID=4840 RepID=UPI0037443605